MGVNVSVLNIASYFLQKPLLAKNITGRFDLVINRVHTDMQIMREIAELFLPTVQEAIPGTTLEMMFDGLSMSGNMDAWDWYYFCPKARRYDSCQKGIKNLAMLDKEEAKGRDDMVDRINEVWDEFKNFEISFYKHIVRRVEVDVIGYGKRLRERGDDNIRMMV